MEVILLPTMARTELLIVLVAPTVVCAMPPIEALPMQAEVVATAASLAQPDVVVVVTDEAAQSTPPVAQVTAPDMGRTEGDMAEGSPDVAAVVERTGGESSLALTLGVAVRLCWMNPCSSGRIHKTRRQHSSPSMMPLRAWSGRVSTGGLRPC